MGSSAMDEWQAIQNEKIRLMGVVEAGIAEKNAEIERLRDALELIARKKKMDACAAASMRAIAHSALTGHR